MAFLQEYTKLDELGKGGYATVFKVRHNELGYVRAVRVLNETIADESSKTYQDFLRECRILLRLGNGNHPNIVHIYQPRFLENKALVEMDYVDGKDVAAYLNARHNFVPAAEVVRMTMQIGSALAYCHEEIYRFCMNKDQDDIADDPNDGSRVLIDDCKRKQLVDKYKVIHNDIHSGNIIRREDGSFVLLDFGLAINGTEVVRSSRHANGAPEFKAPEKWDDESILTEQSDIYSFGIVLFQHLAGRVPFPYNSKISKHKAEFELAEAHQKISPPSIESLRKEYFEKNNQGEEYKKDYPQWLEDMILKCLRKNPAERFRNGKELYDFIVEHTDENSVVHYMEEADRLNAEKKNLTLRTNDLKNKNQTLQTKLNDTQKALDQSKQSLDIAKSQINGLKHKKKIYRIVLAILLAATVAGSVLFLLSEKRSVSPVQEEKVSEETPAEVQYIHDTITIYQLSGDNSEEASFLTEQVAQLQTQISDLWTQITQKENRIKELEAKVLTLSKQKSTTNNATEIESLKRQVSEKQKEITRITEQLRQKQTEIELKNKEIEVLRKQI